MVWYAAVINRQGGLLDHYLYVHCTRYGRYTMDVYIIDGGILDLQIHIHCTRSSNESHFVYWYGRLQCLIDGGVHPLHVAVKFICLTIGLWILLSKDLIINLFASCSCHCCCCVIHNNNNIIQSQVN